MRIKYKGWEFHAGITHSQQMVGVNSKIGDNKHFLMWDFDNVQGYVLVNVLKVLQKKYKLPDIYILDTGTPMHYHAYCFKLVDWYDLVTILNRTPFIDKHFLQIGFLRGYYTLRITPKNLKSITLFSVLPSTVPETVDKLSKPELIWYWTKRI